MSSIVHLDLDISQIKNRDQFKQQSSKIKIGYISKPTTIVDKAGRVLVWYLPKILTKDLHVSHFPLLLNTI